MSGRLLKLLRRRSCLCLQPCESDSFPNGGVRLSGCLQVICLHLPIWLVVSGSSAVCLHLSSFICLVVSGSLWLSVFTCLPSLVSQSGWWCPAFLMFPFTCLLSFIFCLPVCLMLLLACCMFFFLSAFRFTLDILNCYCGSWGHEPK